jgi:hypothetical protein
MLSFDSIPQARVVRKGGQLMTPPPAPKTHEPSSVGQAMRTFLTYAIGMWPLTAIVLLVFGLLIMAGNNGAP